MKKEDSYEFSELSSLPESYLNTSDGGKFSVCYSILPDKRDTLTNFPGVTADELGSETPFSKTFDKELINLPTLSAQRRASVVPDFKARAALYDRRKASLLVPTGMQLFGKRRGSRRGTIVAPIKEDWRDLTIDEL